MSWLVKLANIAKVALCLGFSLSKYNCIHKQVYKLAIPADTPLGVRLDDDMRILEFLSDAQGRPQFLEASGHALSGDYLIQVNELDLSKYSFSDALDVIRNAPAPREIHFRVTDDRCDDYEKDEYSIQASDAVSLDYIELKSEENREEKSHIYAIFSKDGGSASCTYKEAVIANPPHACDDMVGSYNQKYVVISDLSGCLMQQKASIVQESGASGAVFIQKSGSKPMQIKIPSDASHLIRIPLVMISAESGDQLLQRFERTRAPSLLAMRLFSKADCSHLSQSIHSVSEVVHKIEQSVFSGVIAVVFKRKSSEIMDRQTFEFVSVNTQERTSHLFSEKRPLHIVLSDDMKNCSTNTQMEISDSEQRRLSGSIIMVDIQMLQCSLNEQLAKFVRLGVKGIILAIHKLHDSPSLRNKYSAHEKEEFDDIMTEFTVPFVFISLKSSKIIRNLALESAPLYVEFVPQNALLHQWEDIALLSDPKRWPSSGVARQRLYHRIIKDYKRVEDDQGMKTLAHRNERLETLTIMFQEAAKYHEEHAAHKEEL